MGSCLRWPLVLMALLVVGGCRAEIQCNDAVSQLLPCEAYLLSGDAAPSTACCGGVQSLGKVAAASVGDRRAICECFKDVARSFPINLSKAQQVPLLCHVDVTVKIDPTVDCNSI